VFGPSWPGPIGFRYACSELFEKRRALMESWSSFRGRCAGSSAGCLWSITCLASSSGYSPTRSAGESPRWGRCAGLRYF